MVKVEGKVQELKVPLDAQLCDFVSGAPVVTLGGLLRSQSLDLNALFNPSPTEMLLGTLGDARLRVTAPIRVRIEVEGQHFIAEAVEFAEFGFGPSRSEAIRDLQQAIVELYSTLDREQGSLGSDLRKVWENLRTRILARK